MTDSQQQQLVTNPMCGNCGERWIRHALRGKTCPDKSGSLFRKVPEGVLLPRECACEHGLPLCTNQEAVEAMRDAADSPEHLAQMLAAARQARPEGIEGRLLPRSQPLINAALNLAAWNEENDQMQDEWNKLWSELGNAAAEYRRSF